MKKLLLLLICFNAYAEGFSHRVFNFIQFKAEKGEGVTTDPDSKDKPTFGFDRVWLGYIIKKDNIDGLAVAGLNKDADTTSSKLNEIPDSLIITRIRYRFDDNHAIKMGLDWSQMTLGNETTGWELDLPKRTMEVAVSFHQTVGVTYEFTSENKLIPSIQVGVHEPPSRSGAVVQGTKGRQVSYTAKADWYFGDNKFGIFTGKAEEAGGNFTDDYYISGANFRHHIGSKFNLQLEYIKGEGVLGDEDRTQSVSWVKILYNHSDSKQAVIKYLKGISKDGDETTLNNLFVAMNFFLKANEENNRLKTRIQVALVKASGDTDTWNGLGNSYTGDAILTQFQLRFN